MRKNTRLFFVIFFLLCAISTVNVVSAQSRDALLHQIQQLKQEVESLQSQLNTSTQSISLRQNLQQGDRGEAVKTLQKLLNSVPGITIAQSGPGSPGQETTYFGPRTEAAVRDFQQKYASEILLPLGLSRPTGYVGYRTRTALQEMYSTDSSKVSTPTEDQRLPDEVSDAEEGSVSDISEKFQKRLKDGINSHAIRGDIQNGECYPASSLSEADKEEVRDMCRFATMTLEDMKQELQKSDIDPRMREVYEDLLRITGDKTADNQTPVVTKQFTNVGGSGEGLTTNHLAQVEGGDFEGLDNETAPGDFRGLDVSPGAGFEPFGGQTKSPAIIPCLCTPGLFAVRIDDSIKSQYEGDYLAGPLLTAFHRHYDFYRSDRCTLGNYLTPSPMECQQPTPFGCVEYPDVDGLLWNIGTSDEDVIVGKCGEGSL